MKTPTEDHDWRLGPVDWSDYEVSPEDKIKVILNCQVRDWDIAMNFIRKKPTNLNSYILEDMKDQKVSINKAFSDIYDSVNDGERTEIFPLMHPIMKKIRADYRNLREALEKDVPASDCCQGSLEGRRSDQEEEEVKKENHSQSKFEEAIAIDYEEDQSNEVPDDQTHPDEEDEEI